MSIPAELTRRQILHKQLTSFLKKHDPAALKQKNQKKLQGLLKLGLTKGVDELNAVLVKKYKAGITIPENTTSPEENDVVTSRKSVTNVRRNTAQEVSKTDIFSFSKGSGLDKVLKQRVEMFCIIFFPAAYKTTPTAKKKTENGALLVSLTGAENEIKNLINVALYRGLETLNSLLKIKYANDLDDVNDQKVLAQLREYYFLKGMNKPEFEITELLQWGKDHSFTALNARMVEKYERGFEYLAPEEDFVKEKRVHVQNQLVKFFTIFDQTKLEDHLLLDTLADLGMHQGFVKLNEKLKNEYRIDLRDIPAELPGQLLASFQEQKAKVGQNFSLLKKRKEQKKMQTKQKRQDRLKNLAGFANLFFAKYEPNKLTLEDYVGKLMKELSEAGGETSVNTRLKEEYGASLEDIETIYEELRTRLGQFYKLYDQQMLDVDILEGMVGWGIIHGKELLNKKLKKKYDDDLNGSGLRIKLFKFYQKLGEEKTEEDYRTIIEWVFKYGVAALNKRLKKKYGQDLEDMYISGADADQEDTVSGNENEDMGLENHTSEDLEIRSGPPPGLDGRKHFYDQVSDTEDDNFSENNTQTKQSEAGSNVINYDAEEEELSRKLKLFFEKHDKSKVNDERTITQLVKEIMTNGIEAFNETLVGMYGESLNSLDHAVRQKTMVRIARKNPELVRTQRKVFNRVRGKSFESFTDL